MGHRMQEVESTLPLQKAKLHQQAWLDEPYEAEKKKGLTLLDRTNSIFSVKQEMTNTKRGTQLEELRDKYQTRSKDIRTIK